MIWNRVTLGRAERQAGRYVAQSLAVGHYAIETGAAIIAELEVRLAALLDRFLGPERERLLLWVPVFLGVGIGVYFALPAEPSGLSGVGGLTITTIVALLARRRTVLLAVLIPVAIGFFGFSMAQWRTARVGAPVLQKKIGPTSLSGDVEESRILAKGGRRLTLVRPEVGRLSQNATPAKLRVTVRTRGDIVRPGDRVQLRAVLLPPPEPVAPYAFDFSRQAWFDRIGAVGYAVTGLERVEPSAGHKTLFRKAVTVIAQTQATISERVRSSLTGPKGPVAAALMTGDRGAIPEQVTQNLRDAGLAHLLAISGLHMGLMAALLFFAVRGGFALWESVALRYPIKKWAALAALVGAFGYLLLTGATVSTQRAFIMTSIVLLAVMVDRAAMSMRLVAWAAVVVLVMAPESLWHAGFQMSFAAVIALIATYETLRDRFRAYRHRNLLRRIGIYFGGTLLTSLVAGLATAPYAAFHFNRFVDFGLAANIVAVPIMALWIMPWALAAFVLMVIGLEQVALVPMGWGIDAVLWVAAQVAGWPGAVTLIPAFPMSALLLFSLGGLWLCLWRQNWRLAGILPMIAAFAVAQAHTGPDILVDRDGKFFGVQTPDGGLRVSGRHRNFTAEKWLRRAGLQEFGRWPRAGTEQDDWLTCDGIGCLYTGPAEELVALVTEASALPEDCRSATIIVSLAPVRRHCPSAELVIDRFDLWRFGAHGVWLEKEGPVIRSNADARGTRPWTRQRGRSSRTTKRKGPPANRAGVD